jgi:hypothetical protein
LNEARKYARLNGSGCPPIEKPVITRNCISDEAKKQIEIFFSNKEIVTMSSYKVDAKTGSPILYLQNTKSALWEQYSETFPNGIKRTTFMAELAKGKYKYREDLGGLCSTCCSYGYDVFDDLINLTSSNIRDFDKKVIIIMFNTSLNIFEIF